MKKKKQYKQFVQNRVTEVRELTKTDMWYRLSGKENIADLPSRERLPEELSSKRSNWIKRSKLVDTRNFNLANI